MAYTKYTIMIDRNGVTEQVEVKGRKVKIQGYEDFEFFVHRRFTENPNIPEKNLGWTVSEASTGFGVARDFYQKEAIAKSRRLMGSVTRETFLDMIDKAKKEVGK